METPYTTPRLNVPFSYGASRAVACLRIHRNIPRQSPIITQRPTGNPLGIKGCGILLSYHLTLAVSLLLACSARRVGEYVMGYRGCTRTRDGQLC